MPGPIYPRFRRSKASGELLLADSIATRGREHPVWSNALSTEMVHKDAKERVKARQGNEQDEKDVLGEYVMQCGKYRGENFRWLVENVPGYVGWFVGEVMKDEGKEDEQLSVNKINQRKNKDSLKHYFMLFEEGREIVRIKMASVRTSTSGTSVTTSTSAYTSASTSTSTSGTSVRTSASTSGTSVRTSASTSGTSVRTSASTSGTSVRTSTPYKQLIEGPHLPPGLLQSRLKKLSSPQKFKPNIPSREDKELIECLEEFELANPANPKTSSLPTRVPLPSSRSVVKRSFLQSETTLAPVAKPATPIKVCRVQSEPHSELSPAFTWSDTRSKIQGQQLSLFSSTCVQSKSQVELSPMLSATLQTEQATATTSEPLLYEGWKSTLPKVDHQWISHKFFGLNANNKIEFKMEGVTQLWHDPPKPNLSNSVRNRMDRYLAHSMFLWMPVNIWRVQLHCPHIDEDSSAKCGGILTRCGIHQKTRLVLDMDRFYLMAAEYLRCSKCGRKLVSWAHNIVSQLDQDRQLLFPCILTAKYACSITVVELLRQRGLGNSSSMVRKQVQECHGEVYLRSVHHYLTACRTFKVAHSSGLLSFMTFEEPPVAMPIPDHRWLMKIYQLDVLKRLDFIKSGITSLFGSVLKLDSTKKITKKLAGKSTKTAMWATNVGNEYGQVIMTVLTANEGQGLAAMITGLCQRYHAAGVPAPNLLYVDRDCCGNASVSKYFSWPHLILRLDIWHFMRRLSVGCTTDAHPLYGTFMGRLSQCIFQWDEVDVNLLKKAKRAEMLQQHIPEPSDGDVVRQIKKTELALHCRRVTRGAPTTTTLITQLIQSMEGDNGLDILGVPLFDSVKIKEIWAQQSQHVCCIQDPVDIQLYTRIGTMKKGGVELPKYRCARGSTSLESFHLHMNRFIPGTLANDVNFQVFLFDGIHRWNQDRQREAVAFKAIQTPLSYDGILRHAVNVLSQNVFGTDICPHFKVPGKYTGELIGVEYLYSQSTGASVSYVETERSMEEDTHEVDAAEEEDEGFQEQGDVVEDLTIPSIEINTQETSCTPQRCNTSAGSTSTPSTSSALPDETANDESDLGPDNIPGYTAVLNLASFLNGLREQDTGMTTTQADALIELWEKLSDYDKLRTRFPQRFAGSPGKGRFKSPKKQVALGVTSIERAILGPNSTRANWPSCNRYVEATVYKLLEAYPSDRRSKKKNLNISRWNLVKEGYAKVQHNIIGNHRIMEQTQIQLPSLNTKTIQQWYNKKGKERDVKILLQGIEAPQAPMTGTTAPAPKEKPQTLQSGCSEPFQFSYPPDTAGMAKMKIKKVYKVPVTIIQSSDRPILPKPSTPPIGPVVNFPLVPVPITPLQTIPKTVPVQPTEAVQGGAKRKYTKSASTVKCGKCGAERNEPGHEQYMGYRFCAKTESVSFEEWRASLQERGVARRKSV